MSQKENKAPAFQFFANDFVTGTMLLSASEIGGYILLLCYEWDKGPLPNDHKTLARIARVTTGSLNNILGKFTLTEDGYINARLERTRREQGEWKTKSSLGGQKSAYIKWHRKTYPDQDVSFTEESIAEYNQRSTKVQPPLQPKSNQDLNQSSTLHLQSSSSLNTSNIYITPREFLKQKNEVALMDIKMGSRFTDQDWEHCLEQWSLKCEENGWSYSDDVPSDMKKLFAGLQKWTNTFVKNEKKSIKTTHNGKTTFPSDDPAAADQQRATARPLSTD